MSSTKSTLDDLRIDRRSGSSPRETPSFVALGMLLVVTAGTVAWWFHRPTATQVRSVAAFEVAAGGQRTLLNASGYVTARRAATVSSKVTGKVVEVEIEEGMKVEAGQVLAQPRCVECKGEPASRRVAVGFRQGDAGRDKTESAFCTAGVATFH